MGQGVRILQLIALDAVSSLRSQSSSLTHRPFRHARRRQETFSEFRVPSGTCLQGDCRISGRNNLQTYLARNLILSLAMILSRHPTVDSTTKLIVPPGFATILSNEPRIIHPAEIGRRLLSHPLRETGDSSMAVSAVTTG